MTQAPARLFAVDRWFIAFNLFAMAAWATFWREPAARWMLLAHAGCVALPLLLRRAGRPAAPIALFREIYPLVFVGVFWGTLGLRWPFIDTARNDALVSGLDAALFRGHPNLTWIAAAPGATLSEAMQFFYFTYYLLLVGVPLALLARRDRAGLRELMLRVAVTYFTCYMIYFLFPVAGPMEMFPTFAGTHHGAFFRLNDYLRGAGDSLGTAFPSSHVAGAVTFAWVAWRRLPAPVAWGATVVTLLMTLATVYTQHHFALDALAGALLAVVLQAVVVPWFGCPSTGPVAAPADG